MHLLETGIPLNEGSFFKVEWPPEGVAIRGDMLFRLLSSASSPDSSWWSVGYAFNTGWNNTDSLCFHGVLTSAIMHAMLERR